MKKTLLVLVVFSAPFLSYSQCTTSNATSCQCNDITQTDCDLLPDETVSWWALSNYQGGPDEYAQVCMPACGGYDGRIRLSGSTPNIGRGPFEVRGVDQNGKKWFVCNGDTVSNDDPTGILPFTCPNGDPNPKQLVVQRIYHKNAGVMSFYERLCGSMTYHPTHGHYHVDDWEILTLRVDNGDPDPLNWPIVGTGQKIGFCLEDYGSCNTYNGHCRDSIGTILTSTNIPNYALGSSPSYTCSPIRQGISVGYTDIYGETLDNQWINVPPNTCNGPYKIVIQVDPHNYFIESNDNNNVAAVDFTLTQQLAPGTTTIEITSDHSPVVCQSDNLVLTATAGSSFQWYLDGTIITGATDQTLNVSGALPTANYTCAVTNYCGSGTSPNYTVTSMASVSAPTGKADTVCISGTSDLTAVGTGPFNWYDSDMNLIGTGPTITSPVISATTNFYVEQTVAHNDTVFSKPHDNEMGAGANSASAHYLTFTAYSNFTLMSVLVYASGAGVRTIVLQDNAGATLQTISPNIPNGKSRVDLNFNVVPGTYRLACTGTSNLYRNSSAGVGFAYYKVPGVVDITGSDGGASVYYFFYDWKLATVSSTCASPLVSVTAVVDPCTGIPETDIFSASVSVYPNPNSGNFSVEFVSPGNGTVEMKVTDLIGKTIFSETSNPSKGRHVRELDIKHISSGIYVLNVTYNGKTHFTKLVIR